MIYLIHIHKYNIFPAIFLLFLIVVITDANKSKRSQ